MQDRLAVLALLATRRGQGGDRRTRGTWTLPQRIKLAPKRRAVARVVALLAYICSENEPLDETAWAAAPRRAMAAVLDTHLVLKYWQCWLS